MPEKEQLEIVERIYEAALDSELWRDLLARIADHCGAENASLVALDTNLPFSSVIAPRADERLVLEFGQYWGQRDPTARAAVHYPVGQIMSMKEIGRDRFVQSDYYNEYWRKLGYGVERLSANLFARGRGFVNIGLQAYARRDEFSAEMHHRYQALIPHLVRAIDIARKLSRLAVNEAISGNGQHSGSTGAVVVDRAGRIVYADDQAIALMESGTAVNTHGGMICLADDAANEKLRAALTLCAGNATAHTMAGTIACRRDGTAPVMIEVMRFRPTTSPIVPIGPGGLHPVAILLINDPDLVRRDRIIRLQERFGLTQTEAALAVEMLRGDGREAAAARCGISVNTARTHLIRIFDKVGVTRQAELVRVLLDT